MAEKAAEAAARGGVGSQARLGEGRRLRFDDSDTAEAPALSAGDGDDGARTDDPHERNVRSSLAAEFGELRPRGAEAMPTAE
eukprot:3214196-Pleurochrysis_carterae.AAC.1